MNFSLTQDQVNTANEWAKLLDKDVIEIQRKEMSPHDFATLTSNGKYAYYGAIGGGLTYCFTPTGLGVITTAVHGYTKKELNLTDYSDW